ncbi:septal ring lytic transglycosylase RlpA family protein [Luteimonas panaciterrae]|uniref:septal ring lytic transglycosylase RlpA family protein n=1 Tax=Luteimonas panaciterrae TaxID=363885 RepID=UPI001CF9F9CE|nr:septal ring lytic transglycosylase RlpA family protein [Luteimonas panaciterrae]
MRRLLLSSAILVSMPLVLASCASNPKKSASEAVALPEKGSIGRSALPSGRNKRSPYAPAQEDPSKRGNYTRGGLYAPGVADSAPDHIPDVDAIPEPDVVDEPRSSYGNRTPYKVLGKSYRVLDSAKGYDEKGTASYYGNKFHGRRTSNLEVYDMYAFTAAHKTLPLPSFARVTNLDNGKSVVVRVNDRGPFHDGRLIDLSYAAAVKLGIHPRGTGNVEVVGLSPGENARNDYDAVASRREPAAKPVADSGTTGLPPGVRIATGKPASLRAGAASSATTASSSAIDTLVQALPIASANASERQPTTVASAGSRTAASSTDKTPPPASSDLDWRFDMRQDGRAMTADEFDAWMKARRARVATGKAGKPDPYGSASPEARLAATHKPAKEARKEARMEARRAEVPVAKESIAAATEPAPSVRMAAKDGVTLQVAAFGARANAERALSMLKGAGVSDARLFDGTSAGKPIWRLRVGPVDNGRVAELSSRVVGLGFGQPQVVRD